MCGGSGDITAADVAAGSSGRWLQQRASMYTEAKAVVVVISVTAAAAVIVAEVRTQIPYICHT